MRITYPEPAQPRGSIAEVWDWLVNLPYLGWGLLGLLALAAMGLAFYVYMEIDLGRRGF